MFDVPKPKFTPEFPELLNDSFQKKPLNARDFGHTALSVDGLIEPRLKYIDFGSSHGPTFYEKESSRGTEIVGMDARGKVVAANDEEKRIATFGLGGCTAVAVAIEMPDGTRSGYVQHYSPLNKPFSTSMLGEALQGVPADVVSARAVIMTPGEWVQDSAAKYAMSAKDETLTGLLTTVAYQGLGEDADVQVYPYSMSEEAGRYGQGTLMVEFRADGSTDIIAEAIPVQSQV